MSDTTITPLERPVKVAHRFTPDSVIGAPVSDEYDGKTTWFLPVRNEQGLEEKVRISGCRIEEFEKEPLTRAALLSKLVPMSDGVTFYYWHAPPREYTASKVSFVD